MTDDSNVVELATRIKPRDDAIGIVQEALARAKDNKATGAVVVLETPEETTQLISEGAFSRALLAELVLAVLHIGQGLLAEDEDE